MKCKVDGCGQEGNQCGMCGNYTCAEHGHMARAKDELLGTEPEAWICNDCSDQIADAVRPFVQGQ